MNKKEIEALALEATKGIKTEQDLNDFRRTMTTITVEAALNAELDEHLGYSKHTASSTKIAAMCNGQQKRETCLGSVFRKFPLEFDRGLIA